jgi:hypothetical protein
MIPYNWTCPYCDSKTTITSTNAVTGTSHLTIKDNMDGGLRAVRNYWIVCPNPECKRITLTVSLFEATYIAPTGEYKATGGPLKTWRLMPNSFAKVFPTYIPKPLLGDYEEAAAIRDLSPKASATLSRRCLQGMIRDFWGVKKSRLIDEIDGIREKIDPLTWQAIDAVRQVGNIGAHMEKDINLIIDVEPREAQLLIELIELLFKEWYIHKHEREANLKAIANVASAKTGAKGKTTEPDA